MVVFCGQADDGARLVGVGLSRRNCELLLAGKPISIDGAPLGLGEVDLFIIGGEDETDIVRQLRDEGIDLPDAEGPVPVPPDKKN